MTISNIEYEIIKEESIQGRYVNHHHIEPFLKSINQKWLLEDLGRSVQNRSIYSLTIGTGKKRVLIWSQMHGNESTTTRAVLDLINTLKVDSDISREILKNCTIKIIPLLNPDGALAYT
ncbi:MAG: M14 family zinc carboxypeptidase, partial [Flavobacteriaceae bacterium]